jgi:HSP20 family protein
MPIVRRPPATADLAFLHQELKHLFDRLAILEKASRPEGSSWTPPVDVYEAKGKVVIVLEVPGVKPESLKVVMRDRALHVSGERKGRPPAGVQAFLCMERAGGRFTRTVPLDVALDVPQAEAKLGRGLLTVEIPRVKDRRGRETEIPVQREN